jgi:hypothetical protein
VLAAVFLVTARRRLGILRRALISLAVTAMAALAGLSLLYLALSGVHDNS